MQSRESRGLDAPSAAEATLALARRTPRAEGNLAHGTRIWSKTATASRRDDRAQPFSGEDLYETAGGAVFDRGRLYLEEDRVGRPRRQGRRVEAVVQGSQA